MVTDALIFSLSKRLRLLVARLQVWCTLRPTDGHSVNRATEPMLLGSWVKASGFMPISWVMAFMHVQGIPMVL
jgi:hypothetical protein